MREVKYRGLDVLTGSWVYGNLLTTPAGTYIIPQTLGVNFVQSYQVDKDTVGQYTGLKDKNNTEVFEGDIIQAHTFDENINKRQIGRVTYHSGRFGYVFIPKEMEKKNLYYPLFSIVTCELIGNIYENPELLEVPHETR